MSEYRFIPPGFRSVPAPAAALAHYFSYPGQPDSPPPIWVSVDASGGDLRHSDDWGHVIPDVHHLARFPERFPEHARIDAITVPEGIVIRAVCVCGARREALLDGRPFFGISTASSARLSDIEAAAPVVQQIQNDWLPAHTMCRAGVRPLLIPAELASLVVEHGRRMGRTLLIGDHVPDYAGLTFRSGGAVQTVLTSLDDVPDVLEAGERSRTEWIAARLGAFRSLLRQSGASGIAAFAVALSMRRKRMVGAPLPPTAEMAADPLTEWSVNVISITPSFGVVLSTPWSARDQLLYAMGGADPDLDPILFS